MPVGNYFAALSRWRVAKIFIFLYFFLECLVTDNFYQYLFLALNRLSPFHLEKTKI